MDLTDIISIVPDVLDSLDYLDLRCLRQTKACFWVSRRFGITKSLREDGNGSIVVANIILAKMLRAEEERTSFLDAYLPCPYIRKLFGGIRALRTMQIEPESNRALEESTADLSEGRKQVELSLLASCAAGGGTNSSNSLAPTTIGDRRHCDRASQNATVSLKLVWPEDPQRWDRSVDWPVPLLYVVFKFKRNIEKLLTTEVLRELTEIRFPTKPDSKVKRSEVRWMPYSLILVIGQDRLHKRTSDASASAVAPPHWPWKGIQALGVVRSAYTDAMEVLPPKVESSLSGLDNRQEREVLSSLIKLEEVERGEGFQYFSRRTGAISPRPHADADREEYEPEPRIPVELFNTGPRSKLAKTIKALVELHLRIKDRVELDLSLEYYFDCEAERFLRYGAKSSIYGVSSSNDSQELWLNKRKFAVMRL